MGSGARNIHKMTKPIDSEPWTAANLAAVIWNNKSEWLMNIGFDKVNDVELDLQHVVKVYQPGDYYDTNASIVNFNGEKVKATNITSISHMRGECNSRTREEHPSDFIKALDSLDCSQLL